MDFKINEIYNKYQLDINKLIDLIYFDSNA
jgi:hypothetical protein